MENEATKEDEKTFQEQTIFTEEELLSEPLLSNKHIRHARNAIFAAAILISITVAISFIQLPAGFTIPWYTLLIFAVFIASFILLALWVKRKPYFAILGALILFIGYVLMNALFDVSSLWSGLLFKVMFVFYLFKGLEDARAAQEAKDQGF